jgi:CBS domain-containing protein/sporulation protein YlmC with PRC-barrel domain
MTLINSRTPVTPRPDIPAGSSLAECQLHYFSKLVGKRIRRADNKKRYGRLTDLVFKLTEPYPEAVGIYVEHGKGLPSELIPWDRVGLINDEAIFITPEPNGQPYPRFVDQKGWILVNEHLVGCTILDIDGRRTEIVNDVQMIRSRERMILVHVDISFNGFWRKWGLDRFFLGREQLISWRYVQPFSVEETEGPMKDIVTLSVTRDQAIELPCEDLADALEVLSGDEQEAMFAALAPEKAAEVLVEAEPRAKRQLIADVPLEKARLILAKMSVPHIADLLGDLPHEKAVELLKLLPVARAARINTVMFDADVQASTLMSDRYMSFPKEAKVSEVLQALRASPREHRNISYLFIVDTMRTLVGVVDLRDVVAAQESTTMADLMASPVVAAQNDSLREDLKELFGKYHYRMLPVVDSHDCLLGIVRYKDIIKSTQIELRD